MIITASNLQLAGSHASLEYQRRHESLNAGRDGPDGRRQVQLESTSESLRLQAGATRRPFPSSALDIDDTRLDHSCDAVGNPILFRKDIRDATVELVGPHLGPARAIDQLHGQP